jgi:hypothetical protein
MYPRRELIELARHKAVLQRRVALRRARYAADVRQVVRPFAWWNGILTTWRLIVPVFSLHPASQPSTKGNHHG